MSSKEIRGFAGSLQSTKTKKGVFVTTSDFTPNGKKWAENLTDTRIVLINVNRLAALLVEFDVGAYTKGRIRIKDVDSDYFDEYA